MRQVWLWWLRCITEMTLGRTINVSFRRYLVAIGGRQVDLYGTELILNQGRWQTELIES